MTIDAYAYPPCGTNKKIKFYCPDMVADIEKIERMLQGEQRVACLDFVRKMLEKHPDHSVPLFYNAILNLQLSDEHKAEEAVNLFLEKHPENPAAHALKATLEASLGKGDEAIDELQTALEKTEERLHPSLYDAFGAVGQMLLMTGKVLGARSHFTLQSNLAPDDDNMPMQMLMRLNNAPEIPIFLKQDLSLAECPADFPRKDEFNKALQDAAQGLWRKGLKQFEDLRAGAPRNPAILENIAALQFSLGQDDVAAKTLHTYAVAEQRNDFETATEAEALAKALTDQDEAQIDVVNASMSIHEMEPLLEKLRVDERCEHLPIDLSQLGTEESPPPRAAYLLLDKPRAASGVDITLENVSSVLGELLVFGKETDRPARIEFTSAKGPSFDEAISTLKEICGDTIDSTVSEDVQGRIFALQDLMNWQWRLPDDTPNEVRTRLMTEKRREVILENWVNFPLQTLNGKTPLEASKDTELRLPLAAEVLTLEMVGQQEKWKFDFSELKEKLSLPTAGTLPIENLDVLNLPITRLHRLPVSELSDQDLIQGYGRSVIRGLNKAVEILANELLVRESLKGQIDRSQLYGELARTATDSDQALAYLKKAQEEAVQQGRSPGLWMVAELSMRFERREMQEAQMLMQTLMSKYAQEPQTAQALFGVLQRFGLITPDGRMAGMPAGPPPAQSGPEAGGGLWTPGAPAGPPPQAAPQQAAGEEKKSGLWLPGMD
ncbi:hypothetical protein C5Y96_08990 [Blastopirellula marina]|uniref:Uncharacterized protein n=1 Tax=Blastopirellula marina TaxID=124 RepID=A0A2S8FUC2_9BACT|nr:MULTISPECIES: hypothetical protein [Pirellulaceae]PQO35777.1 hypothetical protein C5Y96_08990 [Blastopirellula marina]RCS53352.1 hypothetical protein DTL36_09000 [Bremerella cremea]